LPGHDAGGKAFLCDVHPIALEMLPVLLAEVMTTMSHRASARQPDPSD